MTTIAQKTYNPATKKVKLGNRYIATYSRKHGRPRNVKRILKIRKLDA